jgi:transposase
MMILELHRQGLSISAIAERTGYDRKTARKYIRRRAGGAEVQGAPAAADGDRSVQGVPARAGTGLAGADRARLLRELRELGYGGGETRVEDFLRTVRPTAAPLLEVRFETPAGQQA